MGRPVTINLDPALVADYALAADEHGRSLEVELAEALAMNRPRSRLSRKALVALVQANWARAPWLDGMTDSTTLIREDRDAR